LELNPPMLAAMTTARTATPKTTDKVIMAAVFPDEPVFDSLILAMQ